jgi:tripartite-type tricarboxylate transporter receptor subunit TctC
MLKPVFRFAAAMIAAVLMSPPVYASDKYPYKPIRIILPGPPGGGADLLARVLGQRLTTDLGQTFVIDNRPGAGGMLGMDLAAKAAPDGYTIVMGNSGPNAVIPNLVKSVPYDPIKDFSPISLVASAANLLVVNPSVSANSVSELVQMAKSKPGHLTYASGGNGQASHLAAELFKLMAGINIIHVPFKGSGPAVLDLIGGRVDMMFSNIPSAMPQINAGKLRALAVTSEVRSKLVPKFPTMAESGVPGYESTQWYGLLAPAKVSRSIVSTLSEKVSIAVKAEEINSMLFKQGFDPIGSTQGEFSDHIRKELTKWKKVIEVGKISAD